MHHCKPSMGMKIITHIYTFFLQLWTFATAHFPIGCGLLQLSISTKGKKQKQKLQEFYNPENSPKMEFFAAKKTWITGISLLAYIL